MRYKKFYIYIFLGLFQSFLIFSKNNPSSWRNIQLKYNNAVVQIFTEKGIFNWKEPYKKAEETEITGSGFFINKEGEILTNAHVIDLAKSIQIQIPSRGKKRFSAEVICSCPDLDLALIKVNPEDFYPLNQINYLELGDSDQIFKTDEVMVLGYPFNMETLKITTGIVSGRSDISNLLPLNEIDREITLYDQIQISAPVNPGNSGGPLLNHNGEVIGIINSVIINSNNIGFAIPINIFKTYLKNFYNEKILKIPFLGLKLIFADDALAESLNNPIGIGCYVSKVYDGGLAKNIGLEEGDMIYEIDDHIINYFYEISLFEREDPISFYTYFNNISIDSCVSIIIYRNGERKEINFIKRNDHTLPINFLDPNFEEINYETLGGLVIMPLSLNHIPYLNYENPNLYKYEKIKNRTKPALIITCILFNSISKKNRLLIPGSIIHEINNVKTRTLEEFRTALLKSLTTGFLNLKTDEDIVVALPFKQLLEEELKLAELHQYPISNYIKNLLEISKKI